MDWFDILAVNYVGDILPKNKYCTHTPTYLASNCLLTVFLFMLCLKQQFLKTLFYGFQPLSHADVFFILHGQSVHFIEVKISGAVFPVQRRHSRVYFYFCLIIKSLQGSNELPR